MTTIERFESKFEPEPNSGCWIWTAYFDKNTGYGEFRFNGKAEWAHRVAYQLYLGPIGTLWVLHKCDNKLCVNPNHLFLGSHQDNMKDMVSKERSKRGRSKKLRQNQIVEILTSSLSQRELAKLYNISQSYVSLIIRGERLSRR